MLRRLRGGGGGGGGDASSADDEKKALCFAAGARLGLIEAADRFTLSLSLSPPLHIGAHRARALGRARANGTKGGRLF